MYSTVPRAVQMSVFVVRAFIRMRTALAGTREFAHKLAKPERRIGGHDASIRTLFDAIRQLMTPPDKPRRSIGFWVEEAWPRYADPKRVRTKGVRRGVGCYQRCVPYGVPGIERCLPNSRNDTGSGDGLISRDEAGFPRKSLSHQDPVMHLGNLGQRLKPEDGYQSERDDTEVGGGPDTVDELWNISPYPSTFDDENNLGEDDDRDDDSCPTGNRLCEGMSSQGSQAQRGSQVPDQAVGVGDVCSQRRGPLRGSVRTCLSRR